MELQTGSVSRNAAFARLLCRCNASHHLLLGDQVVNPLQKTEQTLHVAAPFVEDGVGVAFLLEADNLRRSIDSCVDGLADDEVRDVLFRLLRRKIQQCREAREVDASVVLCNHTDVVFDDAFAKVEPSLISLRVFRVGFCREDVGGTKM